VKLATWNINSIRAREGRLIAWLTQEQPDVLCLQETKVEDATFPVAPLAAAGYEVVMHGQRSYNGVAICARTAVRPTGRSSESGHGPIEDVVRGLGDDASDDQARLIAATIAGLRVVCVYVPNGEDLTSEKFPYKLGWYRRLRSFLERSASADAQLVVCGDFNVTADDRDVCAPEKWAGKIHCSSEERAALAELKAFGLVDLFRRHHPDGGVYSWWDYRGVAFFKNQGLRIDHILATDRVAARCTSCRIDRDARKGQDASDHAPVIAELAL
jgi:exodeoxyribonuclease-3